MVVEPLTKMPSIEIPVGNEEVVEIDLNDLEGYDETILNILLEEKVPLKYFVQFAVILKFNNRWNIGKKG